MVALKHNAGFTLIDTLVSIALLAVVSTIALFTVSNIESDAREDAVSRSIKLIERAGDIAYLAEAPFDMPEDGAYSIQALINQGHLDLDSDSVLVGANNRVVRQFNNAFVFNGTPVDPEADTGEDVDILPDDFVDADGPTEPDVSDDVELDKDQGEDTDSDIDDTIIEEDVDDDGDIIAPESPEPTDGSLFCWDFIKGKSGPIMITCYNGSDTDVVVPSQINRHDVTGFGKHAFKKGVDITSIYIPEGITTIEQQAFRGNDLESVRFPDTLLTIGQHAFRSNDLTSVRIPDGVTSIGNHAFDDNNKLAFVLVPTSVTIFGQHVFGKDKSLIVYGSKGSAVERYSNGKYDFATGG